LPMPSVGMTVARVAPTDSQGLRRILTVVDLLLDATAEPTLLPALLPALLRAVPPDSVICSLQAFDGPVTHTYPVDLLDPAVAVEFEQHAADDPLVVHTRPAAPPASFNRSRTDFTDTDIAVADILRPRLAIAMTRLAPRHRRAHLSPARPRSSSCSAAAAPTARSPTSSASALVSSTNTSNTPTPSCTPRGSAASPSPRDDSPRPANTHPNGCPVLPPVWTYPETLSCDDTAACVQISPSAAEPGKNEERVCLLTPAPVFIERDWD
jgi:hypothetical protein